MWYNGPVTRQYFTKAPHSGMKHISKQYPARVDGRFRLYYTPACIERRFNRYYHRYGMNYKQVCQMRESQQNVCAVCQKRGKLVVDHDHMTGRVRCLVCHLCNTHRIGTNTVETARKVLQILESSFDGRML